ncbi:coiled-coil domain-containing protein 92-like [Mizuhopecten yessoensis]|uniref:Coiled-coil domain-containing protein 92 n=1 Tax=Mizuhopecten yessoensis TaxID=6573 RepID=A0A210QJC7_MIZYE|nr:coiled-coil domain-containing protein 92-like [Mizuhopecten yessoensis]XP_021357045.1 coiled-coil domain-containing protein 92-like [Mizuhopecten yessoensis]OWF48701.1 Coiled-coil domain-containing protein 92 [Mizuhopecten yessoensis]
MANETAVHKRNMESAILFMQQEHATTLKALHEEIRNLQKKCSDLTFQINMQGLGIDDNGATSAKVEELQKEMGEKAQVHSKLEKELERKEKVVREIELLAKKQKMKYIDAARKKTQEIDQYKAELESKSNQIAYLTSELHKLKRLQLESAAVTKTVITDGHIVPVPPSRDQYSGRARRGIIRHSKPSVDPEELGKRAVRTSSGKSTSSSRSDSPIELAKPFLRYSDEMDADVQIKGNARHPLPPIRPSVSREDAGTGRQVYLHKMLPVAPPQLTATKHSRTKTREMPILAVDQVSGAESKWAQPQHSHSHEYN